jgi:hypothetical protein
MALPDMRPMTRQLRRKVQAHLALLLRDWTRRTGDFIKGWIFGVGFFASFGEEKDHRGVAAMKVSILVMAGWGHWGGHSCACLAE